MNGKSDGLIPTVPILFVLLSIIVMRVIIDHYGEDVPVERYDDGHFTAKIEVNPSGTFYGWIFKFKGKIKILSPKECITEIQQIAQEFI